MSEAVQYSKIETVVKRAKASKLSRMLRSPYKYINSVLYRKLLYSRTGKEKKVRCKTFFGSEMNLMLPSGTDIYLTGGKSHDSEIRLAKFLLTNLEHGDVFIDVGAHYGYFSQLAATLVGPQGQVYSFEASPSSFNILVENKKQFQNIQFYNRAVSNTKEGVSIYEFPNLYSEYNSLTCNQHRKEAWFKKNLPKETEVKAIRLQDFISGKRIDSCFIKIDVEGSEDKVIEGLGEYLATHSPLIALEYFSSKLGNKAHRRAEDILRSFGFQAFRISPNGSLEKIDAATEHLDTSDLDSDNLVFKKLREG